MWPFLPTKKAGLIQPQPRCLFRPYVIVPVGKDNHHSAAEVVKVEYFAEEDVPLPLDRTKHIIRKCKDDDFDPLEE